MKDVQPAMSHWSMVIRWIARLSSLAINSVFLLILVLALTTEDKPQGVIAAIPVFVSLALTMVSCFAAWRWERAGGIAVLVGAICLGVAAYSALRTYGVDPHFVVPLVYAVPFLFVGALFLWAAWGQNGFGRRTKAEK